MDFIERTPVDMEWVLGTKEDLESLTDESLHEMGVAIEEVNHLKVTTGGYTLASPRASIVTRSHWEEGYKTYVLFVGVEGTHYTSSKGFWFGSADETALRYTAVFWVEHCFNKAIHRSAQRLHTYGLSGGQDALDEENRTRHFWATVIQELERGPFSEALQEPLTDQDFGQETTLSPEERLAFHARLDRFLKEGK